ncbi:hypothetical protein DFQ27_008304, partial [Actinomortierella ambigua]
MSNSPSLPPSLVESATFGSEDTVIVSLEDAHEKPVIPAASTDGSEILPSKLYLELKAITTTGRVFKNWAKTFSCVPEQYFTPQTEDDIVKIIHLARIVGKKVKAIGSGHSPSDLACTDGFMINTDKLNRLIKVDKEARTVTVEAGIRLMELNQILDLHGLALSSLGSISEQSIAGALATATH